MPKDSRIKGPVIAPITLRLEKEYKNKTTGERSSKFYYVDLNVRFRDEKQYELMEGCSFDSISHLFNECLPSKYSLDDQPLSENGYEKDDGKMKFHLDLLETQIYKGSKKTNPNYYDFKICGYKVTKMTEKEIIFNRRLIKE